VAGKDFGQRLHLVSPARYKCFMTILGIQHVTIELTLNIVRRPTRGSMLCIHSTRSSHFTGGVVGVGEDTADEQDQQYL
jgi:hypothetical protein